MKWRAPDVFEKVSSPARGREKRGVPACVPAPCSSKPPGLVSVVPVIGKGTRDQWVWVGQTHTKCEWAVQGTRFKAKRENGS